MRVLVDAREKLHIPWGDNKNQLHGDKLMAFDTRAPMAAQGMVETRVFLQYLPAIKALWDDSGIQNAYDRRREFQLVRHSFTSLKCCLFLFVCCVFIYVGGHLHAINTYVDVRGQPVGVGSLACRLRA